MATAALALVAFFKEPLFPPMGLVGEVKKVVEVVDAKGQKGAVRVTCSPITLLISTWCMVLLRAAEKVRTCTTPLLMLQWVMEESFLYIGPNSPPLLGSD